MNGLPNHYHAVDVSQIGGKSKFKGMVKNMTAHTFIVLQRKLYGGSRPVLKFDREATLATPGHSLKSVSLSIFKPCLVPSSIVGRKFFVIWPAVIADTSHSLFPPHCVLRTTIATYLDQYLKWGIGSTNDYSIHGKSLIRQILISAW